MPKFFHLALVASCISLAACLPSGGTPAPGQEEAESSPPAVSEEENSEPRETPNVTYQGIVQPAGISIYQQGSHRLVLDDNRFILLESNQVDLNGYVGETVEVFGVIRPTVEEGGIIMNVENIRLESEEGEAMEEGEETGEEGMEAEVPEPEDTAPASEATEASEEDTSADSAIDEGAEEIAEEPGEEVNEPEDEDELLDNEVNQPTSAPPSADKLESIIAMSKDAYSAERWTQQYCTGHIGFCIPVHKNWWYKSFGNTTTNLWQVEMRNAPIESIGDGVIAVTLVSGAVASSNATDGQIRAQGGQVTGYRSWEGNTHFEITADARLTEPVTYITEHLSAYQE